MIMTVHTDGGARGNPGPAAIGVVIACDGDVQTISRYIGETTNNFAEYTAVLDALAFLPNYCMTHSKLERIDFFLDSQLVVCQINGEYKVKEPTLQKLHGQILKVLPTLPVPYRFSHVPRAQNAGADRLVNQALDAAR
jgi:ribonuclease HI